MSAEFTGLLSRFMIGLTHMSHNKALFPDQQTHYYSFSIMVLTTQNFLPILFSQSNPFITQPKSTQMLLGRTRRGISLMSPIVCIKLKLQVGLSEESDKTRKWTSQLFCEHIERINDLNIIK